eukprot:GHRR01034855.1.p1 GENE.GHRR01034855.1~~GHRR01034855.1.p1  ORF type:complete len:207 (-),score=58.86 GHRR01034855.1:481-1068(-)
MNDNILDPALADMDPQDMLNKLRAKGGLWHTLARFLPVLYRKGFDTNSIAELTGLNPVDQNRWVVAGTVYDSIEQTGDVDPNVLSFFDVNGDELLYHFRFLPAERRAAAAKFIVANNLDERVRPDHSSICNASLMPVAWLITAQFALLSSTVFNCISVCHVAAAVPLCATGPKQLLMQFVQLAQDHLDNFAHHCH